MVTLLSLLAAAQIDTERLPKLLAEAHFNPPPAFKALVVELAPDGASRFTTRIYSWRDTWRDRSDWWPASTVKLFAAVVALEEVGLLGFSPEARVTFQYDTGPVVTSVRDLVEAAIIPSDNTAFDRLVELVGSDRLRARLHGAGFRATVLLRAYGGRVRYPGGLGDPRHSPRIEISEGPRAVTIPARTGRRYKDCPNDGNCTTLLDLAEAMGRVMLHETIPQSKRFALSPEALSLLRRSLGARRGRGENVCDGLREAFRDEAGNPRPLKLFHKPGFAYDWFSDVVFVEPGDSPKRWIVAMAGRPGRSCLDEAARAIGILLARDVLARDCHGP